MSVIAAQMTGVSIVCSAVCSGADQRKYQSSASLIFGNPPVTGGFPSQRASYVENVSIWWRHHEMTGNIGGQLKYIVCLWTKYKTLMFAEMLVKSFIREPTRIAMTWHHFFVSSIIISQCRLEKKLGWCWVTTQRKMTTLHVTIFDKGDRFWLMLSHDLKKITIVHVTVVLDFDPDQGRDIWTSSVGPGYMQL